MGQLISVRSNQDFSVHYETGKLVPQTEIIILVEKPNYNFNPKGDEIIRTSIIEEVRFKVGLDGLNQLIGKLQLAANKATSYDQMGAALNEIILHAKKSNEEEE